MRRRRKEYRVSRVSILQDKRADISHSGFAGKSRSIGDEVFGIPHDFLAELRDEFLGLERYQFLCLKRLKTRQTHVNY